jgi:general secretion pathway protein D|tara:strand:- start:3168 stop:5027 length:1860 start_codon:yes stop_codon:yes gene_type:complete
MRKILIHSVLLLLLASSANALTLNLKNAELVTFIETVSRATGKNFIVDPQVEGKVNVISANEIDNDELYNLFLSVLRVHGYIAVEGDDFTKILPQSNIKESSSRLSSTSNEMIVTTSIAIANVPANQLIPVLRPIISQYGLLAAYTASNSIVVTDSRANIARLKQLISELDREIDEDYEIIALKNTSADEVAKVIKSLFPDNQAAIPLTLAVDTFNNQIIVGGAPAKRLKVRFLAKELDKKQNKKGETTVVYLRYANAGEILPILQNIGTQVMIDADSTEKKTNNISIQADESTNAIIITASIAATNNIQNVISLLDIRKAQVLIEAIIVEISSSDANELGIQWLSKGDNGLGIINFNGTIPALLAAASGDSISSLAGAVSKGGSIATGSFNSTTNNGFGAILNALAGSGKANILSTPSIVTLDNEEAMIMVGQEVPFITNTEIKSIGSNPFQNFERKDVGLTLIVKPQINEGDTIKLDIEQEISNILPGSNASDLITSKRKIKTSIMVADNKILVLGGLMDDTVIESESKLPGFGDLPILGNIFTYKTQKTEKRNLLIFIRPTILTDQIIADSVSAQKYKYIRAQQLLKEINSESNNQLDQTSIDSSDPELPQWMNYE